MLTILLVAFVVAGLCAFLVYRIVGSRITASKPVPTTRVIAAAEDIKLGSVLGPSDLTSVEFAGGSVPKGAFLKPADVIGRGVISEIYQGEPILESRLAPKGSGGGLAATIPDGMRACAVKVDDVVGVAGFVTPGMRVDVLVSGNPPGGAGAQGTMTKTILQNIEVLSAGTDIQKDAEGKPQQVQVVNLLVTPEQAEALSLASNQLKIQLVLRNPLDTKITQVPSTAMGSLFSNQGGAAAQAPQPPAVRKPARPRTYSITVINGSKTTEERFPIPEGKN